YSNIPWDSTMLMWIAPIPRILVVQGFGLRSIVKVLKGSAKIVTSINENTFIKSFKNIKTIELQGSLASFVKAVAENWNREIAILCEAKPTKSLFKFRVKIASDDAQTIDGILKGFSKLDDKEDLKWAIEKWLLLKPCVKPIKLANNSVLLQTEMIPERLFIAGDREEVERVALQACLSQLRSKSRVLIVNGEDDDFFENRIGKVLEAEGFKPCNNSIRIFRASRGMEVILMGGTDLNEKIIDRILKKPIVALWLRSFPEDIELRVPLRVLTCSMPEVNQVLEADGLLLLNPDGNTLGCFISERYGLMLQGKTVMVSAKEVRILV
ncbi:MAG: hypothetical protein QXR97_01685, partial [Thermoproteota archaeon]